MAHYKYLALIVLLVSATFSWFSVAQSLDEAKTALRQRDYTAAYEVLQSLSQAGYH